MDLMLQVWDMSSGQCVQSIQQAHRSVVMSLLAWEVCPCNAGKKEYRRASNDIHLSQAVAHFWSVVEVPIPLGMIVVYCC